MLKGTEAKIFQNLLNDVLEKQPPLIVIQDDDLLSTPVAAPLKEALEQDYQLIGGRSTSELSGLGEAKLHPVELLGYSYSLTIYKRK